MPIFTNSKIIPFIENDVRLSDLERLISSPESSALFWPCVSIAAFHVLDALCYIVQGILIELPMKHTRNVRCLEHLPEVIFSNK